MKITELSLRDGLQGYAPISLEQKLKLLKEIKKCGYERIEVGSLTNPKLVPAMADSFALIEAMDTFHGGILLVLDPTLFYQEVQFIAGKVGWISFVVGATEKFNHDNLRSDSAKINKKNHEIILNCLDYGLSTRVYISVAFENIDETLRLIELYQKLKVTEIVLGETTGRASVEKVRTALRQIKVTYPNLSCTLHFHNTYGQGLLSIKEALDLGYDSFDASIGGLGGCPFVKNSAGNVSAEEVIYAFGAKYDLAQTLAVATQYHTCGLPLFSRINVSNYNI